jgi:transcriptional regulator with XRE-family HTH domain
MADSEEGERGTLAAALVALRTGAGLSQRGLAEVTGVSQGTIRDIETGKQRKPRWDTLRMLADGVALGQQGVSGDRLAGAAYRTLLEAAGHPESDPALRTESDPGVDCAFHFFHEFMRQGTPQGDAAGTSMSQDWRLARVLERIQLGMPLARGAERAMILEILNAIAERLTPTEGRVHERLDRSDVKPLRRGGGRVLEI